MIRHPERGAVAAFALGVLVLISLLAGSWLRLVAAQVEAAGSAGIEGQARLAAEAGIERLIAWFADPSAVSADVDVVQTGDCGPPVDRRAVLLKRCVGADGLPGYVGVGGVTQFGGTLDEPGLRITWSEAAAALTGPWPAAEGPRPAPPSIRVDIRVFAPRSPNAVATVVSRATVGGASAAIRAELSEGPWRGFQYAVATRRLGGTQTIPVRVHWGATAVDDALDATALVDRLPRLDPFAPVTGSAYPSEPGADRWAGLIASGSIAGLPRDEDGFAPPFAHVREGAGVSPFGIWSHAALKAFAKRHGRYFATRGTGRLYLDDGGPGVSPAAVAAAHSGPDGLLFIDTLDGESPRDDNLDTLDLALDHLDATAYIGAHIRVVPGIGRAVTVDSPPDPAQPDNGPAVSGLTIEGVHYRGALIVAGSVSVDGRLRLVGALAAFRGVRDAGAVEVWYDAALHSGYRAGFPPVVVAPGSRRQIAIERRL